MSPRLACYLAWSLCMLTVLLIATAAAFSMSLGDTRVTTWYGAGRPTFVAEIGFAVAFAVVGALVASRNPSNLIGWLFLSVGLNAAMSPLAIWYASYALYGTESLPGGTLAAWLASWIFVWGLGVPATFVMLLFPNGELLSPRWRVVQWLSSAAILTQFVGFAFAPGTLYFFPEVDNPVGASGRLGQVLQSVEDFGGAAIAGCAVASAAAMILRLRRSTGVERQQLRWFAYASAIVAGPFAALPISRFFLDPLDGSGELFVVVYFVTLAAIPIASGIAILRYHLYDIDLVIRSTLVYGSLSIGLALIYASLVIALQLLLGQFTTESDWAVATATLVVAALFQPFRKRLQRSVDRRFYRRRYDAVQTVESFAAQLQGQADLSTLRAALQAVVNETMQPVTVSMWIRPVGKEHSRQEG